MVAELARPGIISRERLASGNYSLQEWQAHYVLENAPYIPRWEAFKELTKFYIGLSMHVFDGNPPVSPHEFKIYQTPVSEADFLAAGASEDIPRNFFRNSLDASACHNVLVRFAANGIQYVNRLTNRTLSWEHIEKHLFAVKLSIPVRINGESLPDEAKIIFGQEDDFGEERRGNPFHPEHVSYDLKRSMAVLTLADHLLAETRLNFLYHSK